MNRLFPAALAAALTTVAATGATVADPIMDELNYLPKVEKLPKGVEQVSPFIPGMGEHWANPKDMPFGPIYCVIRGHVTCMEYMISQKDFAEGRSFVELKPWFDGATQPAVNHMEFGFQPKGHHGFEVPHYDVHMYFVSPEVRNAPEKVATK
jgi:hypothetical protein